MSRDERFTQLEEYILAGYGDTMQSKIPADWRTRPKRIQDEICTKLPLPEEKSADCQLAAVVLENEADRDRARGQAKQRLRKPTNYPERRSFAARVEFRAAAMRARAKKRASA